MKKQKKIENINLQQNSALKEIVKLSGFTQYSQYQSFWLWSLGVFPQTPKL